MSHPLFTIYCSLLAGGFVLIAAEIFIPGGVLGVLGVLALITAMVMGFVVFGAQNGMLSAVVIFAGGILFIYLWVKYFPKSSIGKWFTLTESGKEFKSFDDRTSELLGQTGMAHTDLRPSGIALINQQKIDVLSEAGFIERGTPVKVIQVVGSRIVVRAMETPS